MPVDTDVCHVPAGPNEIGRELECLRHADRFEGNVRAKAIGELHDRGGRVLAAVVDCRVGAEPSRAFETAVGEVYGDDAPRGEEPRGENRREPDRPGTDDRDHVARCNHAVENSHLV